MHHQNNMKDTKSTNFETLEKGISGLHFINFTVDIAEVFA